MLELANGELTVAWVRGMTYLKKMSFCARPKERSPALGPGPFIKQWSVKDMSYTWIHPGLWTPFFAALPLSFPATAKRVASANGVRGTVDVT